MDFSGIRQERTIRSYILSWQLLAPARPPIRLFTAWTKSYYTHLCTEIGTNNISVLFKATTNRPILSIREHSEIRFHKILKYVILNYCTFCSESLIRFRRCYTGKLTDLIIDVILFDIFNFLYTHVFWKND